MQPWRRVGEPAQATTGGAGWRGVGGEGLMGNWKRVEIGQTADLLVLGWEAIAIWPWLLYIADDAGNIEPCRSVAGLAAAIHLPLDVVERGLAALLADGMARRTDRGYWVPVAESPTARRGGPLPMRTYVIQRGDVGPVKIGRSRDVLSRVAALQTACAERLRVLHVIDDDHEDELHVACAAHRTSGEWFDGSPEFFAVLAVAIKGLR